VTPSSVGDEDVVVRIDGHPLHAEVVGDGRDRAVGDLADLARAVLAT
jgi:hypothetical protein